ncbi:hypothetical protein [Saccharopolyspora erythraea]|uniref:hypothetical protein n=1 Tax=Saccharopolyspora erythraea TaxID=1836 RepID=UPI0001D312AF|nr:hypothetical protein [Saccharopolyspora erythraea]EQD85389.1 hypothetical protein N599_15280 [Saccharopolyspora erythraea D]
MLALGLVGLVVLVLTPALVRSAQPAPAVTVVRGKMGSKVDFFRDTTVQEILRRKNFEVIVDNSGSREVATHDVARYDFVFPSGQPAAEMIMKTNMGAQAYVPFVSPIVLATYRPYAEALHELGIATPMTPDSNSPLYYRIDVSRFVELTELGTRWNDIGIREHGIQNNNLVLAHTCDVCLSNSGGTYQGLIAYAKNGGSVASSEAEVAALAESMKPLYRAQGAPTPDRVPFYLSPEGKRIAPIVVIYEHQYLAHQLRRPAGQPDEDRVLLYPADHFETQPAFIALNDNGRKLAQLLRTDPQLRTRAVELGFRVLDAEQDTASPQLTRLLNDRGIEAPSAGNDHTRAYLPTLDLFEMLITTIGGCR